MNNSILLVLAFFYHNKNLNNVKLIRHQNPSPDSDEFCGISCLLSLLSQTPPLRITPYSVDVMVFTNYPSTNPTCASIFWPSKRIFTKNIQNRNHNGKRRAKSKLMSTISVGVALDRFCGQ